MTGPGVELVVALWLAALAVLLFSWVVAGLPGVVLVAAVLATSYSPAASAAECNWHMKNDSLRYSQDKRWHFEQTAAGTLALMAVNDAANLGMSDTQMFWLAVLPGFLHEVGTACDSKRENSQRAFSHEDMVWNMLGAAVGVGVGNGVRVLLAPRSLYIYKEW